MFLFHTAEEHVVHISDVLPVASLLFRPVVEVPQVEAGQMLGYQIADGQPAVWSDMIGGKNTFERVKKVSVFETALKETQEDFVFNGIEILPDIDLEVPSALPCQFLCPDNGLSGPFTVAARIWIVNGAGIKMRFTDIHHRMVQDALTKRGSAYETFFGVLDMKNTIVANRYLLI